MQAFFAQAVDEARILRVSVARCFCARVGAVGAGCAEPGQKYSADTQTFLYTQYLTL
jgi:hypothetical protein